jgi:hypothetical protein
MSFAAPDMLSTKPGFCITPQAARLGVFILCVQIWHNNHVLAQRLCQKFAMAILTPLSWNEKSLCFQRNQPERVWHGQS